MNKLVLVLAVPLAFGFDGSSQTTRDFSGTWRLDLSRSDVQARAETPGPVTVSITQSPEELSIATTTSKGTTTETYRFAAAGVVLGPGTPIARWKGDTLVTDAIRDVRGQSVTVQQSRRLSDNGNEMFVESVVNVQHGYSATGAKIYGASKDVFVKQLH
jgi:hypothetical protein